MIRVLCLVDLTCLKITALKKFPETPRNLSKFVKFLTF